MPSDADFEYARKQLQRAADEADEAGYFGEEDDSVEYIAAKIDKAAERLGIEL